MLNEKDLKFKKLVAMLIFFGTILLFGCYFIILKSSIIYALESLALQQKEEHIDLELEEK